MASYSYATHPARTRVPPPTSRGKLRNLPPLVEQSHGVHSTAGGIGASARVVFVDRVHLRFLQGTAPLVSVLALLAVRVNSDTIAAYPSDIYAGHLIGHFP